MYIKTIKKKNTNRVNSAEKCRFRLELFGAIHIFDFFCICFMYTHTYICYIFNVYIILMIYEFIHVFGYFLLTLPLHYRCHYQRAVLSVLKS